MSHIFETGCTQHGSDVLRLTDEGEQGLEVRAVGKNDDRAEGVNPAYIQLDEASARALFNWLGVWLHGGNRA